MEYRHFGNTDITVSAIGLGGMDYRVPNAGGTNGYGQDMVEAISRAIDLGITCFDTAATYGGGDSERMYGRALGPRRKDVVLITKCGIGYPGRPESQGRDSRREPVIASIDESLQRLRTDYVDVYLIHLPDVTTPFEETMDALDNVVQQGKARAVGLCNVNMDQIKECQKTRQVDVVQCGFNMFDRRMDREIFPYCQEQGIGVMAFAPLGFGILSGIFTMDTKYRDNDTRAVSRPEWDGGIYTDEAYERNLRLVDDLRAIAAKRGKTMPQLALRWVLSNTAVSVAPIGTHTVAEVEENLGVLEWALSAEDLRQIDEVFASYGVDTQPDLRMP